MKFTFFYFSNLFYNKNNPFLLLSTLSFLPYWVIDLPNDFTLYHPKCVLLPIMSTFRDIIPKTFSGCLKSMHIIPIENTIRIHCKKKSIQPQCIYNLSQTINMHHPNKDSYCSKLKVGELSDAGRILDPQASVIHS